MALIAEVSGVIGVAGITAAYFLLNLGKISAHRWPYPFVNFVGASLIVWSLTYAWNLSAFMMEASWAVISFYGLLKSLFKSKENTSDGNIE